LHGNVSSRTHQAVKAFRSPVPPTDPARSSMIQPLIADDHNAFSVFVN
jgi:hypothetical protein